MSREYLLPQSSLPGAPPAAFAAHPERFVRGLPQPPALPAVVWLNPPPEEKNQISEPVARTLN